MRNIKEITCFCWGDSHELKTWSNVPYYFTRGLETSGLKVNRIDLKKGQQIFIYVGDVISKIFNKFYKEKIYYDYSRTKICDFIINIKMRKAVRKFPDTDLFLSLSFSFNAKKYTDKINVMFCDWSIYYAIEKFGLRSPIFAEKGGIYRQNQYLKACDYNITLFPDVESYYKLKSFNNIKYLGNVINSEELSIYDKNDILEEKKISNRICFIGKRHYKEGLEELVKAFLHIADKYNLYLDIIGFDSLKGNINDRIVFWGYLDKANMHDNRRYYDIIKKAKIIINTTPKWAGFSSMIEAMYWYTPVIVTKYENFSQTFGDDIEFGYYCDNDYYNIMRYISMIFEMEPDKYISKCNIAHSVTNGFTWSEYVKKFLEYVCINQF